MQKKIPFVALAVATALVGAAEAGPRKDAAAVHVATRIVMRDLSDGHVMHVADLRSPYGKWTTFASGQELPAKELEAMVVNPDAAEFDAKAGTRTVGTAQSVRSIRDGDDMKFVFDVSQSRIGSDVPSFVSKALGLRSEIYAVESKGAYRLRRDSDGKWRHVAVLKDGGRKAYEVAFEMAEVRR